MLVVLSLSSKSDKLLYRGHRAAVFTANKWESPVNARFLSKEKQLFPQHGITSRKCILDLFYYVILHKPTMIIRAKREEKKTNISIMDIKATSY